MFIRNYDYQIDTKFNETNVFVKAEVNNKVINIPSDIKTIESNLGVFGGTRSGKTTFLINLIQKLRRSNPDILFVILDVKKDFSMLHKEGDKIFSIKNENGKMNISWSILKECYDSKYSKDTLKEIIQIMFEKTIKDSSQPFFPEAAQEVLYGLLLYLLNNKVMMSNKQILQWIKSLSLNNIKKILESQDLQYINTNYLYENQTKMSGQCSGILSTLYLIIDSYFIQDETTLYSTQDILNMEKGSLFLQYDIRFQKSCNNLMRLILKLIIQNKLSINSNNKRVFLVLDEVSVLQGDFFLSQVLNIGAGKKISTILSLQSIDLLYQCINNQNEHDVNSILGGFQNFVCFRPRDIPTKNFIQHLGGETMMEFSILPSNHLNTVQTILQKDNIVTSKDIETLNIGEVYIKILNKPIFRARLLEY